MRRTAVLLAAAVVLVGAAPAAAGGDHRSCQAFGAESAALGQAGALGELASGVATSGPGALAGVVAAEHEAFCSP
jgi:hypothetical protein